MRVYAGLADHELTALIGEGDRAAFTALFGRYWKKILQVAWNHTKDKQLAEDLVHEVFIHLWERRENQAIENIGAFLATAIKYRIFKHYQRELRRQELARQHYSFSDSTSEEEKWDALFLAEYIAGLVEELPEKCRLVFRASREAHQTNAEIAAQLGISEKAVEANMTRALKLIRGGLENAGILFLVAASLHGRLL